MTPKEHRRAALVAKFQELGQERVERICAAWVRLEQHPQDEETAAELLRELHTLKGESRTVGFNGVNVLSHRLESLVVAAQGAGFKVSREVGQVVLGSADVLGALLRRAAGAEAADLDPVLARIDAVLPSFSQGAPAQTGEGPEPLAPDAAPLPEAQAVTLRVRVERVAAISEVTGELLVEQARTAFAVASLRARAAELERRLGDQDPAAALSQGLALCRAVRHELSELDEVTYRKGLLVDQLDYLGSELRLVPASTLLDPYPRMVRDLAHEQGKEVSLEVEGGQTEADRRVLETLQEPLVHLLRNSVDHGIEAAAARVQLGKPARGKVSICLQAQGSSLSLTVSDDGAGLHPGKLAEKAVAKGLLSAAAARSLDPARALELIFLPGFSTKDQVSHLSGRGVGMDVVKRRVEQVGGRVRLQSTPGQGTVVEMVVPIAISRTRALVMRVGDSLVALPSMAVEAVLALDQAEVRATHGGRMLVVDGALLPLGDLEETLEGGHDPAVLRKLAVVLRSGSERRAFAVEEAGRELDLVARPLGPPLQQFRLSAGAAVLPSGELALLLDVPRLLELAGGDRAAVGLRGRRPKRHRVLAVDDSVIIQNAVSDILRGLGCEVALAGDGLEGLAVLETFGPDLVITDLQMPRLDGMGFIRRLRADARWRSLPLVVLSSLGSAADRAGAAEAGASAYLVKSELDETAVREVLRRLLD